jgi:hypothetical protein
MTTTTEKPFAGDEAARDENARLLARIEKLEAELKDRGAGPNSLDLPPSFLSEVADKAGEEASRFLHALAHVVVEELRATAEVVEDLSATVFRRGNETAAEPATISAVLNRGAEKMVAAPKRIMEKWLVWGISQ